MRCAQGIMICERPLFVILRTTLTERSAGTTTVSSISNGIQSFPALAESNADRVEIKSHALLTQSRVPFEFSAEKPRVKLPREHALFRLPKPAPEVEARTQRKNRTTYTGTIRISAAGLVVRVNIPEAAHPDQNRARDGKIATGEPFSVVDASKVGADNLIANSDVETFKPSFLDNAQWVRLPSLLDLAREKSADETGPPLTTRDNGKARRAELGSREAFQTFSAENSLMRTAEPFQLGQRRALPHMRMDTKTRWANHTGQRLEELRNKRRQEEGAVEEERKPRRRSKHGVQVTE